MDDKKLSLRSQYCKTRIMKIVITCELHMWSKVAPNAQSIGSSCSVNAEFHGFCVCVCVTCTWWVYKSVYTVRL